MMNLTQRLYRSLYRIHQTHERTDWVASADRGNNSTRISTGRVAVSVGVCDALERTDVAFDSHGGHATRLARGGRLQTQTPTPSTMMTIGHAVGYAHALKQQGSRQVVVAFVGDSFVERIACAESLQAAVREHLPILFVCQSGHVADRARTLGIPAHTMDCDDVLFLRCWSDATVNAIRCGSGPRLLEATTACSLDDALTEMCQWLDPAERSQIEAEVHLEIDLAFTCVKNRQVA